MKKDMSPDAQSIHQRVINEISHLRGTDIMLFFLDGDNVRGVLNITATGKVVVDGIGIDRPLTGYRIPCY
jgi:hypothetical protein